MSPRTLNSPIQQSRTSGRVWRPGPCGRRAGTGPLWAPSRKAPPTEGSSAGLADAVAWCPDQPHWEANVWG